MGRSKIDMTGQRYGRLLVIEFSHGASKTTYWKCKCDCGEQSIVMRTSLINGNTTSCGCYAREQSSIKNFKHGLTATKTYHCWESMRARVAGRNHPEIYFNRGISIDRRWLVFKNFLEDMGEIPNNKNSLDRIDPNGNYCKENCRWATHHEQADNRKTTRKFTFLNQTYSIAEWALRLGIDKRIVANRINKGWDIRRTLTKHII